MLFVYSAYFLLHLLLFFVAFAVIFLILAAGPSCKFSIKSSLQVCVWSLL